MDDHESDRPVAVPPVLPWEITWRTPRRAHRAWVVFAWALAAVLVVVAVALQL